MRIFLYYDDVDTSYFIPLEQFSEFFSLLGDQEPTEKLIHEICKQITGES